MEEIAIQAEEVADLSADHIKGDSPEFQRKSIFRKLQDSVQESSKTFLLKMTGEVDEEKKVDVEGEAVVVAEEVDPIEKS